MKWKDARVSSSEGRSGNCWISPSGEWFNVAVTDHEDFAISYLDSLVKGEINEKKAGDVLLDRYGWIYVQSDVYSGTVIRGRRHMSPDQYMVLLEYWGDTPLLRGWTISAWWKESSFYTPPEEGRQK